jgi:hypothetical protein
MPANKGKSELSDIEKKFVLDKYSGKNGQNAKFWLEDFEEECIRYNIHKDEEKITCLRLFLTGNSEDWYTTTKYKLGLKDWKVWSNSFLRTYSNRGWSNVRYAYSFKYIEGFGSMIDYALKKERLLLECERTMTEESRISHIVVGLPTHIQNKLDKEIIETTEDLMNEIQKYNSSTISHEFNPKKGPNKNTTTKEEARKDHTPCHICTTLGKPNRFHPTKDCWNRNKTVNLTTCEENILDVDNSKN